MKVPMATHDSWTPPYGKLPRHWHLRLGLPYPDSQWHVSTLPASWMLSLIAAWASWKLWVGKLGIIITTTTTIITILLLLLLHLILIILIIIIINIMCIYTIKIIRIILIIKVINKYYIALIYNNTINIVKRTIVVNIIIQIIITFLDNKYDHQRNIFCDFEIICPLKLMRGLINYEGESRCVIH